MENAKTSLSSSLSPYATGCGIHFFPEDPLLYDHLQVAAVLYAAHRYLSETETLVEFGCGTRRFLSFLATT